MFTPIHQADMTHSEGSRFKLPALRRLLRRATVALLCLQHGVGYAAGVPEEALRLADSGHYRRALAIIEPLARANPGDVELQFRWGEALLGTRRPEAAIDVLSQVIAKSPNNGVYRRVRGEAYRDQAQRQFESGGSMLGMVRMSGVMRSAREEFEAAVRLDPQDVKALVNLASFHIMLPAMLGGSLETAHALEDKIDRLDPVQGLRVRAMEAEHKGDVARAEAILKRAVELDTSIESRAALGLLYVNAKRYPEATALFRALAAGPGKPYVAWYQLGRIADLSRSNEEEGIRMLQRYLAYDDLPDTATSKGWAHYRLGNLFTQRGQLGSAKSQYAAAQRFASQEPALRQRLKENADSNR
jgi:tetratricopeptide (TPR) repeat protein